MFESIRSGISNVFHTLKGNSSINEVNIATAVKEIKRILVQSDVNYDVVTRLIDKIQKESLGQSVIKSLTPREVFMKVVYDQITQIMTSSDAGISLKSSHPMIMLVGLQGAGKTTFASKLGHYIEKQNIGKKVLLVACDVYRPAAIEQLTILGKQAGLGVFHMEDNNDVIDIIRNGIQYAKNNSYNIIIVDTAGRTVIDTSMMNEIKSINDTFHPNEVLLVVDAMIGQTAVNTAIEFNKGVPLTGTILTKLDSDTKGGVALSIVDILQKPIKFIGTGEKLNDIDIFHPDRIAQRILDMGDTLSLIEKAKALYTQEQERKLRKEIYNNTFSYESLLENLSAMSKIGSIRSIIDMIPGVISSKISDKDIQRKEEEIKQIKYIVQSMTPKERTGTIPFSVSRRREIAYGSGVPLTIVESTIKQFDGIKKMMQKMKNLNPSTIKETLMNMQKAKRNQ